MSFASEVTRGKSKYARKCVRLLAEDSAHFFNTVNNAGLRDGVLRAVFSVDPMSNEPVLKRAQAVTTESLDPAFADTLEQLRDTCNPKRQIVAWFTCESETGALLDHGTAVLDKDSDDPVWEGVVHRPPSKADRNVASPSAANGGSTTRPNQFGPSWDQRGRPNTPNRPGRTRSSGGRRGDASQSIEDMKKEIISLSTVTKENAHPSYSMLSSPSRASAGFSSPSRSGPSPPGGAAEQGEGVGVGGSASSSDVQYQVNDIMNICLLVSRATAKIAMSVNETQSRLDKLYDIMAVSAATQKHPQEIYETLLYKVEGLEAQMTQVELALPAAKVLPRQNLDVKHVATETHPQGSILHRAIQTDERVNQRTPSPNRHVAWADVQTSIERAASTGRTGTTIPATTTATREEEVVVEGRPVYSSEIQATPSPAAESRPRVGVTGAAIPYELQQQRILTQAPLGGSIRSPHDRVLRGEGQGIQNQITQQQGLGQLLPTQHHQLNQSNISSQQVLQEFPAGAVEIPLRNEGASPPPPAGSLPPHHQFIDLSNQEGAIYLQQQQQQQLQFQAQQQQPQQQDYQQPSSFSGTIGDYRGYGEADRPTAPHDPTRPSSHYHDGGGVDSTPPSHSTSFPNSNNGQTQSTSLHQFSQQPPRGFQTRSDEEYYNQPVTPPSVDASATEVTSRRHALPTNTQPANGTRSMLSRQSATAAMASNSPSSTKRGPPRLR